MLRTVVLALTPSPSPKGRGEPEKLSKSLSLGLPCTHKSSDLASTGFDPPQPPLKKGEPDSKSPFFKGDLGGSLQYVDTLSEMCVHGSPRERD